MEGPRTSFIARFENIQYLRFQIQTLHVTLDQSFRDTNTPTQTQARTSLRFQQ